MKSKDFVFYAVALAAITLLVLSPQMIDSAFAAGSPINSMFSDWLAQGEKFVNSMEYAY